MRVVPYLERTPDNKKAKTTNCGSKTDLQYQRRYPGNQIAMNEINGPCS